MNLPEEEAYAEYVKSVSEKRIATIKKRNYLEGKDYGNA